MVDNALKNHCIISSKTSINKDKNTSRGVRGVFFVAVIFVAFIFDRQTGTRGYDNIINIACPCYVVVGLLLMVRSHYLPEKKYRVPLTGYSTHRGNSVYFRFKGQATKHTYSLSGYNLTNICERYDVELYLKEPLPTVYYVCGISLCKRDSISK